MDWHALLYNSILNNNITTFKTVVFSDHIVPEKFNNKALFMAYCHENNEMFDLLTEIESVKKAMFNDNDKILLNHYNKRKILKIFHDF